MDHFLSGLDHGPNPWYAPRQAVAGHGHEFAIGNSSFQLIPITGSSNHTSSSHSTYNTSTNQLNLQSAFKPPADSTKVKSEVKDEDERDETKTPSPSVALTPLSTNMAHHSHKAKNSVWSIVQQVENEEACPDIGCKHSAFPSSPALHLLSINPPPAITNNIAMSHILQIIIQDIRAQGERWDTKKVCNICGKVLSRGDKLKNHIRTHTNNFPFHCDTCGQGFLRSEGLRVHNRIHTGERPYVCIICGKAYTRKDKLTRHAIVHTGERPFVCQHCGKSFTRKDKMQRHEMIHKIEKPFTCVPCNLEFVRQETFNAHMERKHPERLPYTIVQQPRAGSPGYHPQGLNLSSSSDSKHSSSSKHSQSSTKVSSSTTSTSSTTSSGTSSLLSGATHASGTSVTSGSSLLSSASLLSGTSLLSSSALLSGVSLPSGSGAQTLS
ncbi:uncharacterized protein [Panulirus ornatus]|uniref:uncharacterized protein isoform X1 n=2 Tax=Panulirus ornatus TaxID=150431 RepID=UPI003A8B719D